MVNNRSNGFFIRAEIFRKIRFFKKNGKSFTQAYVTPFCTFCFWTAAQRCSARTLAMKGVWRLAGPSINAAYLHFLAGFSY
jgi:hypothetical protein